MLALALDLVELAYRIAPVVLPVLFRLLGL